MYKWYNNEMQQHSFPLSSSTLNQAWRYGVTNGQHTTQSSPCQQCPDTAQLITPCTSRSLHWCAHKINHIESYWDRIKTKVKRMKGCHRHQLSSYLDEFMWRERHGVTARQAFDSICRDIALKYPV